jgi:hypothetical protein
LRRHHAVRHPCAAWCIGCRFRGSNVPRASRQTPQRR